VNFNEAESYLLALGNEVETMKLGLDNIRRLLADLGDPQNNYLKVQIAGTNGKGSVCAFLRSICLEAGIKAGVFTSPHLISITERINIGGVDIAEDEFARFATKVRETSEQLAARGEISNIPTFFEQVTAIALLAFADAKVDVAILETGLGGRLDATTAANAEIAAITRIDYDHQQFLGETIEEIAAEKAAIIRKDSKVVLMHQSKAVEKVIIGRCSELGVSPYWATTNIDVKFDVDVVPIIFGSITTSKTGHLTLEFWHMLGRHQFENAAVAIAVAELLQDEGYAISTEQICRGLETTENPGRLEYIGRFLLDGAHNVGGAKVLVHFLNEYDTRPITMIFGAMKEKDVREMLSILLPRMHKLILTKPDNSRATPTGELLKEAPKTFDRDKIVVSESLEDALTKAGEISTENEIILVTGSLYLVGEAKRILNN
jgi:dihydrofolate synthase / folylpolyglutamate synthase